MLKAASFPVFQSLKNFNNDAIKIKLASVFFLEWLNLITVAV